MKMSRRELSIDMVIHRDIFKNNQITLFPSFTFIPKTEAGKVREDGVLVWWEAAEEKLRVNRKTCWVRMRL